MIMYPRQGVLHGKYAEGVLLGTDVARPYVSGAEWAAALTAEIKYRSLTGSRAWTAIMRQDLGFPTTVVLRSDRHRWIIRNSHVSHRVMSEMEWHEKFTNYFHTIVEQLNALTQGYAGLIIFSQDPPSIAAEFIEELYKWVWVLRSILRVNVAVFRPDANGRRATDLLDFLQIEIASVSDLIETYTDGPEDDEVVLQRATKALVRHLGPSTLTIINPILAEYGYKISHSELYFGVLKGLMEMRRLQIVKDREVKPN